MSQSLCPNRLGISKSSPPCFQGWERIGSLCWGNFGVLFLPYPHLSSRLPSPNRVCGVDRVGAKGEKSPGARLPAPHALLPSPGYAEPLKGVPPEKFNHTAIPKGYRCPWQEFISYRDYQSEGRSHTPSLAEYRNFNK